MLILWSVGHGINQAMRGLFIGALLKPIFGIINMVYKTIISIAQTPIISGEVVYDIFNKVQLILAVFMIFRIMITVLQMIISPDSGKNESGNAKGGTKFTVILKRILLGLILLVLLRPVNIPVTGTGGQRQLNEYVANHGIIFGILYDLQYRILDNNNIGCIISSTSCNTRLEDSEDPTTKFSDYLVASFVHPNTDDQCNPDSDYLAKYKNGEMTADDFMKKEVYTENCEDDKNEFLFEYNYVILFAGAGIILYILIGFLIDVAIRSIKLSILRLISPIPVISYMANEKDQVLNNWIKNLVNTYVDLFIRLAIIFLAFSLIGQMLDGQSYLSNDEIGIFTKVVISIALLIFVKMAPKYIMDILGIKGSGSNIGLGALSAGVGALRQGGKLGDARDAMVDSVAGSQTAYNQGKQMLGVGASFTSGRDMMARRLTGNSRATAKDMREGQRRARRMQYQERLKEADDKLNDARDNQLKANALTEQFKKNGWEGLSINQQRAALDNLSAQEQQDLSNLNGMIARAKDSDSKEKMIAKRNQFYQNAVLKNQNNADVAVTKAEKAKKSIKELEDNFLLNRTSETEDVDNMIERSKVYQAARDKVQSTGVYQGVQGLKTSIKESAQNTTIYQKAQDIKSTIDNSELGNAVKEDFHQASNRVTGHDYGATGTSGNIRRGGIDEKEEHSEASFLTGLGGPGGNP